jgi:type II secretory pathway pseudopilin PulG
MRGHGGVSRARPAGSARAKPGPERGFSLIEAIVATVIATIAVMGLAYSFGTARGLVNRYEAARVALAAAQRRMELLSTLRASDPLLSGTHQADVVVAGTIVARESWTATPYADPEGPGLKRVVVRVAWGGATTADSIQLARLFPPL